MSLRSKMLITPLLAASLLSSIVSASLEATLPLQAHAQNQITSDNSLGAEQSQVLIDGSFFNLITGGAARGQNLFHSFEEFSIGDGSRAYFVTEADTITNIFARITGGNPSDIQGVLGTRQFTDAGLVPTGANLFLINPNGILFGENAALDVGGSFIATTASAIQFEQSGLFSTTDPAPPSSLLTINPSALFFSQLESTTIENRSQSPAGLDPSGNFEVFGLRVPDGESLIFAGGNVKIDSGILLALGGRIDIGGLSQPGIVELADENSNPRLSFHEDGTLADISIINGAGLTVLKDGVGEISIHAGNLLISDFSFIEAGISDGFIYLGSSPGKIELFASDMLAIDNNSLIFNYVAENAEGNSGDVSLNARQIRISDGSQVGVLIFGIGNTGSVDLNATDTLNLDGNGSDNLTGVFAQTLSTTEGDSGDINLLANNLEIEGSARIDASTFGRGNAGQIILTVQDDTILDGSQGNSLILNNINQGANGSTGGIEINTGSLLVINGSQIQAEVSGVGNAGNVVISARDDILLDGRANLPNGRSLPSAIFAGVDEDGIGNSGNIQISGRNLNVTNRAQISSITEGSGNAGNIFVQTQDNIYLLNSILISEVTEGLGNGDGGDIFLETGTLELVNGSSLLADTENIGNAGNIIINASERVTLIGEGPGALNPDIIVPSQITTTVDPRAIGQGGDITIISGQLAMTDSAFIRTSTFGQGDTGDIDIQVNSLNAASGAQIGAFTRSDNNAGTIFIRANDRISVDGQDENGPTEITSSSLGEAQGNGGAIFITTPVLLLTNQGRISAVSEGLGFAGNIDFTIGDLQIFDGSIETNASRSSGGNIRLNALNSNPSGIVILRGDGDVTTDSFGNGGNITLNSVVIAFDDSDILSRSTDARGGNITLGPFFSDTLPIGAVSPTENNGRVDISADGQLASGIITTPDTSFIQNSLNQLPVAITDPSTLITGSCIARADDDQDTFVVTGSGGLPTRPGDSTVANFPTGNVQPIANPEPQAIWQPGDPIVEPTGVFALENGRLVLSRECDES
jgi:filamentous hemagglutinin family protein